jgi:hypothetical protein
MSYSFIEKIVSVLLALLKMFIDEKEREHEENRNVSNNNDNEVIDHV